jgi:starvation-inducible DNA-binding protein
MPAASDQVSALLAEIAADEMALYVKTIKFHWDVANENFTGYYDLFESQYKQLEVAIEGVSQRISSYSQTPMETVDELLEKSELNESTYSATSYEDMIKELFEDHTYVIERLQNRIYDCDNKYQDTQTADFLNQLMDDHKSSACTLQRYLK